MRITLSFDEAVHGCKKNITITRQQECTCLLYTSGQQKSSFPA